jgi:hypothetical protein
LIAFGQRKLQYDWILLALLEHLCSTFRYAQKQPINTFAGVKGDAVRLAGQHSSGGQATNSHAHPHFSWRRISRGKQSPDGVTARSRSRAI